MNKIPNYTEIPNKNGRYVVLDTETTGLFCDGNHIIEVAAIEIKNGYLTGNQFHAFLKPRKKIDSKAQEKHKMNNNYYKENYENMYESDKTVMQNLIKFIDGSIIFAHNASFDMQFLNHELTFWHLPEIPIENFRCTMRIFKNLFESCRFKHTKGNTLSGCCQFFNIKFDDKDLHSACYDAMLTAKLTNSIYEFLYKNPNYLTKKILSNYSYLLNKSDYYGKKPTYSFLNGKENQQSNSNDNFVEENTENKPGINYILNDCSNNNDKSFNRNENKSSSLIVDQTNIFKGNEEQILRSAEKNQFKVTNSNGVISAKKVNQNDEMELLVYDTNNEINRKNSKADDFNNHRVNQLKYSNNEITNDSSKTNFKTKEEDRKIVDVEKEVNYIQKIYGDNKNINNNNTSSGTYNLTNNNLLNLKEISMIENKTNYSFNKVNNLNNTCILNEISLVNNNNIFPNNIYKNSQIKVSEFQIENLNLIVDQNVNSNHANFQFHLKGKSSRKIRNSQNSVQEINDYIEDNADEVYNLVKNLNEDQPMEIEISEDERSVITNNYAYQSRNFDENSKIFNLNDEGVVHNLENRDIFNIRKSTHSLRSKVSLNKSNKLHNYDIESKKPRLKKMMRNLINENNISIN